MPSTRHVLKPGGTALIVDIRHIRQYSAALRAGGCNSVRRASSDFGTKVLMVITLGLVRPGNLIARKDAQPAPPSIVFVDKLEGETRNRSHYPIVITPVALFDTSNGSDHHHYGRASYTFVQCVAGSDTELDEAAEWIVRYATKYTGRVITNFDEQRPVLADAPLSYQRLVAKTYERTVIDHFHGTINAARIDQLTLQSATIGEIHTGHKINVGGSAIINIDSVLKNVTQTIGAATGLKPAQKKELDTLVQSLRADLDKLKVSHADETKEIADALEKAIGNAAKAPEERKQSLLQLSAKGLREAAELVKDVAPTVLATAGLISKFIVGL